MCIDPQSLCNGSADEFSTSTSMLSTLARFVRLAFDENRSRNAQSVRPFVQSSSWNACGREIGGVSMYLDATIISIDHQYGLQIVAWRYERVRQG
jgi:hypothetical protein